MSLFFGAKLCDLFLYNQAGDSLRSPPKRQIQKRTLNGFNPPTPRGGEGQNLSATATTKRRCSGIPLERSVTRFKPFQLQGISTYRMVEERTTDTITNPPRHLTPFRSGLKHKIKTSLTGERPAYRPAFPLCSGCGSFQCVKSRYASALDSLPLINPKT